MAENSQLETGETLESSPTTAPRLSRRPVRSAEQHAPKLVPDRRLHRRVRIRLLGRFMRADQQEYPCQIINMSAGGIALVAPVAGEVGERIVVYVDDIGRIEGDVVRTFADGFAVSIVATAYKRDKLANQLTWIVNRERLSMAEERAHNRYPPNRPYTNVTLADGQTRHCRVLDISLSGASLAIDPRPPLGQTVLLGRMRGSVVRHHDLGVGVQFIDIQEPAAIQRQFG